MKVSTYSKSPSCKHSCFPHPPNIDWRNVFQACARISTTYSPHQTSTHHDVYPAVRKNRVMQNGNTLTVIHWFQTKWKGNWIIHRKAERCIFLRCLFSLGWESWWRLDGCWCSQWRPTCRVDVRISGDFQNINSKFHSFIHLNCWNDATRNILYWKNVILPSFQCRVDLRLYLFWKFEFVLTIYDIWSWKLYCNFVALSHPGLFWCVPLFVNWDLLL